MSKEKATQENQKPIEISEKDNLVGFFELLIKVDERIKSKNNQ